MSVRRLFRGGLTSIALLAVHPAGGVALFAQQQEADKSPEDRVWREKIVVSASRFEQSVDEVTSNVTVLDEASLERNAALTGDDFLRRVPGFSLFRRASSLVTHPTSQGVSLRGIGPSGVSRTLVLLDGVPLNDPFGGWVYWSRVPMDSLERVEIARGGASNLWGNFALGGVIQLLTRDPEAGLASVRAEGGNHSTALVDATISERWDKSAFSFGADYFDTGGYFVVPEEQRGAIDVPADSQHFNGGLRYLADVGDRVSLSVRGSYFEEDRGNGTPLTGNDTQTTGASFHLVRMGEGGGEWSFDLFGQGQDFASTFSSQALDRSAESPALDQFLVDSLGLGLGVRWLRSYGSDSSQHRVSAGGELTSTDGDTNEDFFFREGLFLWRRTAGGQQLLGGIYGQDVLSVGERWQVQLGARVDRWESSDGYRKETSNVTGEVRRDERPEDRTETQVSPRIGALYQASPLVGVRASVYRSFRAPTINELFRPFRVRNDITEANASLVPETLAGAEVGADFRGQGSVRGKLTAFWNELDDAIANVTLALGPGVIAPCGFTPAGGSCRQRQNLDRVRVRGTEAEIEYRPSLRLRVGATYLFSDTEILEAATSPDLVGKQIAQVPRNQLVLRVGGAAPGQVDLTLQGRYVDDQFEDDLNQRTLGSFVVFDLAASRPIADSWNVFLRFENLLNETFEVGETADGLVTTGMPFLVHGGFRVRLRH